MCVCVCVEPTSTGLLMYPVSDPTPPPSTYTHTSVHLSEPLLVVLLGLFLDVIDGVLVGGLVCDS